MLGRQSDADALEIPRQILVTWERVRQADSATVVYGICQH